MSGYCVEMIEKGAYGWRYLLRVLFNEISTFIQYTDIIRNYLAANTHVYLVACSGMHAYLEGLQAFNLFFV